MWHGKIPKIYLIYIFHKKWIVTFRPSLTGQMEEKKSDMGQVYLQCERSLRLQLVWTFTTFVQFHRSTQLYFQFHLAVFFSRWTQTATIVIITPYLCLFRLKEADTLSPCHLKSRTLLFSQSPLGGSLRHSLATAAGRVLLSCHSGKTWTLTESWVQVKKTVLVLHLVGLISFKLVEFASLTRLNTVNIWRVRFTRCHPCTAQLFDRRHMAAVFHWKCSCCTAEQLQWCHAVEDTYKSIFFCQVVSIIIV